MKIAVNCWVLRNRQLDGIGNFTVETIPLLIKAHPEIEFQVLCDKNFSGTYFDFPNVTLHPVFPALRHPVLYVWYMETVVKKFLSKHKPDLFLSMDGFLSLRSNCKQLPVIYDLNFEHYPGDHKIQNRIYYRTFFKRFAKKATRIATISEYSKKDITVQYATDALKIDNVSCGIKEKFKPISDEEKTTIKNKYTNGAEYLFFIGSMHPRKNIVRLILAFEAFKKQTSNDCKLVLGGHILWDNSTIKQTIDSLQHKADIIFTGRLSDEELKDVLGAAHCLSFVPTFEGFGLPIVEAFQAAVPVICSNTTSMPEVAGDAAIQVDPFKIEEITAAMMRIYGNETLRTTLVEKGFLQKNKFSWERTASLLYDCIKKAVQH